LLREGLLSRELTRATVRHSDRAFRLAEKLRIEVGTDNLKAVHHWRNYLKLDHAGQWAEIARRQLDRLRQATLVHSRP